MTRLFAFLLLLPLLLLGNQLRVAPPYQPGAMGVYTLILKNGMRVVMKPTPYEEGEIYIQASAMGGFASLPKERQPAARVAKDFFRAAQVGDQTADALFIELFENGLAFSIDIQPTARVIQGEGRSDRAAILLRQFHDLFDVVEFDDSRFRSSKGQLLRQLTLQDSDDLCQYERHFNALNSSGCPALLPIKREEVEAVLLEQVKLIYQDAFHDPAEFVVVITGDFQIKEMAALAEQYLQTIPRGVGHEMNRSFEPPLFPAGITAKVLTSQSRTESLTRLTFPITEPITEENLPLLALMTETIEARLRLTLKRELESTHGIDASFEMPLAPSRAPVWLTIQFRADPAQTARITEMAIAAIKDLKISGPTAEDISQAKILLQRQQNFFKHDNDYWLAELARLSLWGWDLRASERPVSEEGVAQALTGWFPLDNYTIITSDL